MLANCHFLVTSQDELVLIDTHLPWADITVSKQSLSVLTTFSSMLKRCVFEKCVAVNSNAVLLHKFPKDEKTKKL